MDDREAAKTLREMYGVIRNAEQMDAVGLAIEALEKQIPKSATNTRFDFIGDAFGGKCKCGCVVYEYHTYCPDCGQKIDWGNDNATND